jgi:hypothetical protein
MIAWFLAAVVTPLPSLSPSPSPAPSYTPRPCGALVRRAKLDRKPMTADNLGVLLARAIKDHGYRGARLDVRAVSLGTIDFLGCFASRGPVAPAKGP